MSDYYHLCAEAKRCELGTHRIVNKSWIIPIWLGSCSGINACWLMPSFLTQNAVKWVSSGVGRGWRRGRHNLTCCTQLWYKTLACTQYQRVPKTWPQSNKFSWYIHPNLEGLNKNINIFSFNYPKCEAEKKWFWWEYVRKDWVWKYDSHEYINLGQSDEWDIRDGIWWWEKVKKKKKNKNITSFNLIAGNIFKQLFTLSLGAPKNIDNK